MIKIHSHSLAPCHSINNWQLKKKLATSHCVEMIATQHPINTSNAIHARQAQCGQRGAERDVHKNKPYRTILDNISLKSPDTIDSMAYGSRRKWRMNNGCCRPRCFPLSALLGRHNLHMLLHNGDGQSGADAIVVEHLIHCVVIIQHSIYVAIHVAMLFHNKLYTYIHHSNNMCWYRQHQTTSSRMSSMHLAYSYQLPLAHLHGLLE